MLTPLVGILQAIFVIIKSSLLFFVPASLRYKTIKDTDIVLITGAGSGLGRGLAIAFSRLGCKQLILWDINEEGLKETKSLVEVPSLKCQAYIYVVDVTRKDDVYAAARKIKDDVNSPVTYLINNAGIVSGTDITEIEDDKIIRTFEVNAISHFWTLKTFLPNMMSQNEGHIVTIASLAGHMGVSKLTDYCSSKHAAIGTHRALSMELIDKGLTGVKTTCVCPYFIDTGMFSGVRTGLVPILKTQHVVESAISGILLNQDMVIIPSWMGFLLSLGNLVPTEAAVIVGDKVLQYAQSMHSFRGRENNQIPSTD